MTADVVVVGAGVIGASAAWHLASRGARVTVVDRAAEPGGGSTARATGGYRAQFGSEVNVRLSLLSRGKLLRFRDEVGADAGYRPAGYLFVARRAEHLAALREAQAVQRACGLAEARMVDAEEAARLNPAIVRDGVLGGAFCPTDGFIAPMQILRGYLDAARRLGARVELGAEVMGLKRGAVETTRGAFPAGCVVNAGGAWAAAVAEMAGVDLPVRPLRRHVAPTVGTGALSSDHPMTVFCEDGFHFRVRDGRALLLWPGGAETVDPFDTRVDADWLDRVEALARERVPGLADVAVDRAGAWAGLYEMSPDGHAILGRVGDMVLANGSSGHGVMHAPALGQLIAEIVLDGKAHSLDVNALRPERFAEGKTVRAVGLL